jgi:hypothetical protein
MQMKQQIEFATPREHVSLTDCFFYHTMDLPGIGVVGTEWDLRANVDAYLGNVEFAGKRVLEIGPASGFLTFTMEDKGATVVCLELSEDKAWEFVPYPDHYMAPVRAQRRAGLSGLTNSFWLAHKLYGSSAKVYYGDACEIPDALGHFDIALMAAVLLHCQNPTRIIEQCAQRASTIVIVERLFPEIEGTPTCRLVPSSQNMIWDTWWDFSTHFFVEYLQILGFDNITTNIHEQLFKRSTPLSLFTIVASRPLGRLCKVNSIDSEEGTGSVKTNMIENETRFVHALYRGMLGREPDPEGAAYHINALLEGRTHTSIAEEFAACKEQEIPPSVKLFVPPGHFYSPIVDPVEAQRYLRLAHMNPPAELPGISLDGTEMIRTWQRLLPFLATVPFTGPKLPGLRYYFDNPSYSWGDGSILHAMLRLYRPKRLIEIGSGWSSACTLDTVERYLSGTCEVTFIDPYPHLLRDLIGTPPGNVRVLEIPVQNVPRAAFETLQSGDILFVDSTHILRTGSDVCFELFEILPSLESGVLVHFHDIFWPFEYPRDWIISENRSWNELYAIRAFLTYNHDWRIVFFNDYLAKLECEMISSTYAPFMRNSGAALWLERL